MRQLLLVDGRVLDDHHPGVRDFWVPILAAWAEQGGERLVACSATVGAPADLLAAGWKALELAGHLRLPWQAWGNARKVSATGAAAVLSPLYLTLSGAPVRIATIFDLIGRTHPRSWLSRALWELAVRRVVRHATAVVCATRTVAADLESSFPALRGRTHVVSAIAPPLTPIDPACLARFELPDRFALALATHRPHKRLAELSRVWREVGVDVPLVLAGHGTEVQHAPPLVRGLGFVKEQDVRSLLVGAACLVSSSCAEGFGLPVLAAMAAGVPVVATRQAALQEVAGDAALWLDTDDIAGLVHTAAHAALQPASVQEQVARGKARAAEFSAARSVRELNAVLAAVR